MTPRLQGVEMHRTLQNFAQAQPGRGSSQTQAAQAHGSNVKQPILIIVIFYVSFGSQGVVNDASVRMGNTCSIKIVGTCYLNS